MFDIDAKLKPLSHPFWNISYQYAEELGSNLLQFQQSIISSMKRIPWPKEMGEKTLNIFIEDITYMFYCLSMICTFCI
jgi:hypothetical protein